MSKEKNTVELKDEELEKVSGGDRNPLTCPNNFTQCGPECAGCPNLQKDGDVMTCGVTMSSYNIKTAHA